MVKWIKELFYVVKNFRKEVENINKAMSLLESESQEHLRIIRAAKDEIVKRTNIHADISFDRHSPNQIIVIGRYNKVDYIQTYSIMEEDLRSIIEHLRGMQQYGVVQKVDAPIGMASFIRDNL